ncbi:MAG: YqaE/Pmp3 family membrane protein [Bacteroidetes bacterium]|nr:YqaE/Pmp3 family membrane protein [Bacteroidota bacterium]
MNAGINPAAGDGITKGLYILLAILGLAWIAMGVKSDWSGNDWIVNLILTVLCWLPGFIHALVKMKEYYK